MHDETQPHPTQPLAPSDRPAGDVFAARPGDPFGPSPVDPFGGATSPWGTDPAATLPAGTAAFTGRTPRKGAAIRAGIVIGSALLVAIGTAVAMGASPTPSGSAGGAQPPTVPRAGNGNTVGPFGPFGGFGPFGRFGPGGGPALGGPGNAGPLAGPGLRGDRGFGQITVTAISGTSVSLKTDDGWTRTITVPAAATITKGGQPATFADLAVGDAVRFAEKRNDDGTFTISAVAIVLPQTAGTVTAVGSDTITIKGGDGSARTIHTNASTTYHRGQAAGNRSDVTVGSMIVAVGSLGSDGSLTATSIAIRLPEVLGTVGTVGTDTVTITRRDGTSLTVHVGSGVTIRIAGVASPKLSDVKTGMVVVVQGSQRADGSLDATAIQAGKFGRGHDKVDRPKGPAASANPGNSQG